MGPTALHARELAFDRRVLGSELAGIDATAGKACVCDLQTGVGVAPNLLSYHLKALREAGLVPFSPRARAATGGDCLGGLP